MKQKLDELQDKIGKLMQQFLVEKDFKAVTALSPMLGRVQELSQRCAGLEQETGEVEAAVRVMERKPSDEQVTDLVTQTPTSFQNSGEDRISRNRTLRIKIDWRANHRDHETEEIGKYTAAETMSVFVSRLIKEYGNDVIQKLERIRINRGPLLSKNPGKDFLNRAQGRPYGHKKLAGSDYYILTHSSTAKKIDDLRRVCRVLGMAPGSVQIGEVSRDTWLVE